MSDALISCPHCNHEFKLTDSLAGPILAQARTEHARELAERDATMHSREEALSKREAEMRSERASIDVQVADRLEAERQRIAAQEAERAKAKVAAELSQQATELDELRKHASDRETKLAELQQAKLDLLRNQATLEDAKRELESQRENDKRAQEMHLADERKKAEADFAARLERDRAQIVSAAFEKAKALSASAAQQHETKIADLAAQLKTRDEQLVAATEAQAVALKRQRELDDEKRELTLTVEKQVQAQLAEVRSKAEREERERLQLSMSEKDIRIEKLQRGMEELQHKFDNKSQQLQGEALEVNIEEKLRARFTRDRIEEVPKGHIGADVLQYVIADNNQQCGVIAWELKRTKTWSHAWLEKLRDDQRATKADLAVIVSEVLPDDVESFDFIDGVWVVHTSCAIPVAVAMRERLIEVARQRQASTGQQDKMQLVYGYLTSPVFKQRVEAIVEAFKTMKEDLHTEQRVIQKQWKKREKEIENVIEATVGMYGDLEGIAGASIPKIDSLSLHLLEEVSATA